MRRTYISLIKDASFAKLLDEVMFETRTSKAQHFTSCNAENPLFAKLIINGTETMAKITSSRKELLRAEMMESENVLFTSPNDLLRIVKNCMERDIMFHD